MVIRRSSLRRRLRGQCAQSTAGSLRTPSPELERVEQRVVWHAEVVQRQVASARIERPLGLSGIHELVETDYVSGIGQRMVDCRARR